jgi:hypothetical protein
MREPAYARRAWANLAHVHQWERTNPEVDEDGELIFVLVCPCGARRYARAR